MKYIFIAFIFLALFSFVIIREQYKGEERVVAIILAIICAAAWPAFLTGAVMYKIFQK